MLYRKKNCVFERIVNFVNQEVQFHAVYIPHLHPQALRALVKSRFSMNMDTEHKNTLETHAIAYQRPTGRQFVDLLKTLC